MKARRIVLLWIVYGALIATPFLTRHEIPGTTISSRAGAIIIGVLIGGAWTLITWLIFQVAERLPFRRGKWVKPTIAHVGLFILCATLQAVATGVAAYIVSGGRMPRIDATLWSTGELAVIAYGTMAFVVYSLDSTRRAQTTELQLAAANAAASEAKLHALRAQLRPHFLFNALNTVAMAIRRSDRQEALAVVLDLSGLLRTALERSGTELVSVADEVDFIRQYLEIQQIRFRDRLRVTWAIEESAQDAALPSMILQPLAENAVRHGIGKKVSGGEIRIRIATADDRLHIAVEDDGPGFPAEWQPGVGLANVQTRLALHFGERATFHTSDAGAGASVRLSIPYTRMNGNAQLHTADR
jgi:two-component system, LytTR family, sensor kinase